MSNPVVVSALLFRQNEEPHTIIIWTIRFLRRNQLRPGQTESESGGAADHVHRWRYRCPESLSNSIEALQEATHILCRLIA